MNAQEQQELLKIQQEDWMVKKWRPAMGWTYMGICILDMAIFPILWNILQVATHSPISQWMPLTLQGAGLFHLAMGAVLGIAAWSRGQEKISGVSQWQSSKPPYQPGQYSRPDPDSVPATTVSVTVPSDTGTKRRYIPKDE
jgi:Holin of 3TMs, for gene-transfer release